uniref:Uncharacterized protein n=1 Tax=Anguilla anguilla TaxID=7936 RepID=A0A0E9V4I6_ANGAN
MALQPTSWLCGVGVSTWYCSTVLRLLCDVIDLHLLYVCQINVMYAHVESLTRKPGTDNRSPNLRREC